MSCAAEGDALIVCATGGIAGVKLDVLSSVIVEVDYIGYKSVKAGDGIEAV